MTLALDTGTLGRLRINARLTERALARAAGTSPLRIRRLEAGIAHPQVTLALLDRLATALGTSPHTLLNPGTTGPIPPAAQPPRRPLTIAQARVLHAAQQQTCKLPGRGPTYLAAYSLISHGILRINRAHPTRNATLQVTNPVSRRLANPSPGSEAPQPS